jgi:hypothetical protein
VWTTTAAVDAARPATAMTGAGCDAAAGEAVTESGEGTLQVGAAHEDPAGVGHAAFRSWAER